MARMTKSNPLVALSLSIICNVKASPPELNTEKLVAYGQVYAKTLVCIEDAGKLEKYGQIAVFENAFGNMNIKIKEFSKSEVAFF